MFHHQVKHLEMRVVFSTLLSVYHLVMKHYIPCLIYYVKTQPTAIDAEVWVFSSPFKEKVKSPSFSSVTRNSHLINKHEAGSAIIFFSFRGLFRAIAGCSEGVPDLFWVLQTPEGILAYPENRFYFALCVLSAFKRNALTSRQNLLEWDMKTLTALNFLKADKLTMGWS